MYFGSLNEVNFMYFEFSSFYLDYVFFCLDDVCGGVKAQLWVVQNLELFVLNICGFLRILLG